MGIENISIFYMDPRIKEIMIAKSSTPIIKLDLRLAAKFLGGFDKIVHFLGVESREWTMMEAIVGFNSLIFKNVNDRIRLIILLCREKKQKNWFLLMTHLWSVSPHE